MKTLIVNSDLETGRLLEAVVRSLGHEATLCKDAETAIALYKNNPFPLIILERDLPGVSGVELSGQIRTLPDGGTCVILIITSSKDEKDLQECLNAGIDDYLAMPVDDSTLRMRLIVAERMVMSLWERKIFEESLMDNEERFRSVVETANDAIICINRHGEIIFWNHAAERIFGYGADEIIGKTISTIIPAYFREKHSQAVERLLSKSEGIETSTEELTAVRRDGYEFPAELSRAIWKTAKGVFFTGIIRDITERKKALKVKEEFCSIVSHELKTPLTAMRGSLGLLLGGAAGDLSNQAERLVRIAHSNCERLIPLINDIMDLERLETGRMHYEMKPVHIVSLVEQTIEANFTLAEQFGVRLEIKDTVDDAVVIGDSVRLVQVITNLISNAVKYSPPEDIVMLSVSRVDGSIRVSVVDHGSGVPEEFGGRLFQKFAQADTKDTRRKGGTGLGLSISKAIVERHSGRIVYEREGGDTVFYFDLPEHIEEVPEFKVPGDYVAGSFYEALEKEWKRAFNNGHALSLIMIGINSVGRGGSLGPERADQIAAAIERVLMRSGDSVLPYARGDLAIILPETNAAGALSVAERVRSLVEELKIERPTGVGYITVSLGIATTVPTLESPPDALVNGASQSLYRAMQEGGNKIGSSG